VLLNKESKRETPSVVTFTHKQRMMGTDAGEALAAASACSAAVSPQHTLNPSSSAL
jgi:molecular chaperone DnaK (HSP70)